MDHVHAHMGTSCQPIITANTRVFQNIKAVCASCQAVAITDGVDVLVHSCWYKWHCFESMHTSSNLSSEIMQQTACDMQQLKGHCISFCDLMAL